VGRYILSYSASDNNGTTTVIRTIIVSNAGYDASLVINDWISRVTSAGGSVSAAEQTANFNFVYYLMTNNNAWSKILRINTFCGSSLAAALCPLKNNSGISGNTGLINDIIQSSSLPYNRTGGITGDGSNAVNTGLKFTAWSTNGTNMHFGLYAFTNLNNRCMGVWRTAIWERHYLLSDGDGSKGAWGGTINTNADSNSIGMNIIQSRTSTEGPYYYRRAVATQVTGTINTTSPADWPCTIFGANGSIDGSNPNNDINGWIYGLSTTRVGGYTIGYGLTDAQITDITNAFNTLNSALSRS
jgi:hypothetical protein